MAWARFADASKKSFPVHKRPRMKRSRTGFGKKVTGKHFSEMRVAY